ncbi:Fur family transcriptional regulator [Microbispora corallina]|uniref:Transcriptional repressor n=1 Tax=Microbispora corallina TaxID=83302 RepID=A0ABQ4G8E7_9ACTN|nr:Fur family transcriptional regulator [Microbispora corallina]GIH43299.1 transcriptional repressor [Microbispora corallina]
MAGEAGTRMREAGLRVTRPRVAVIGALEAMRGHHTADEVHAHLARNDVALPRTSVYNSLTALADAGLVMRADVGRGAIVYEVAETWHHHFVCGRCGGVSDVPCLAGARPCLTPGEDVGAVDEAQVVFRGTCRRCLDADGGGDTAHEH